MAQKQALFPGVAPTLQDYTPLSEIVLPKVGLPEDLEATLALTPPHMQQFVHMTVNLAQCSRAIAQSYQRLSVETELLRAERDSLASHLRGNSAPLQN